MNEPKSNEEQPENIGALFEQATDDMLVDNLLAEGPEPAREEPVTQQPQQRQAPQKRTSGYEPLIKAKKAKIAELYKRLESFDAEDSPYVTEGPNGEKVYNHAMFQRENLSLGRMKDELADLERKRDESESSGQRNSKQAYAIARKLLEREVAKLPRNLHQPVVKLFGTYFTQLEQQGEWGKADYADPTRLRDALVEVLDNAVGRVARQQATAPAAASPTPGTADDLDDDGAHDTQDESEKDDDFTNNVMYAYEQRRVNRGKTIGQVRREQRAHEAKGGER